MKTTMAVTDVIQKGMQELKSKFEEFQQDHLCLATGEDPEGKETVDGDATSGLDGNRLRSTEEYLSRKFDFLKKLLLAEIDSHRTHDDSEADLLRAIGTKLETVEHELVKWRIPVTIECPVHDDLDHILPCNCTFSCFQNNEQQEDHDDDDHGDVVDKEEGMFEESPAVEAEDADVLPLLEEEEEDHDDDDHGDVVDKEEGMFEESPAVEAEDADVLPLLEEEEEDHDDDDHGDVVDKEDGMFEESPAVEAEDADVLPLLEEEEVKNDVKKTEKWPLGYRMLMAFLLVLFAAIIRMDAIEGDEYDEFLVPT